MHSLGSMYFNMSTWAEVVRACHRAGQWWGQAADFRGPGRVLRFLVVLSSAAECERCAFTGTSMHALGSVYSNMSTWADVVRACHLAGQWWVRQPIFCAPADFDKSPRPSLERDQM